MKTTNAPHIEDYYLDLIQHRLDELPRTLSPGVAHMSELELCPCKPFYARTMDELPPLSRESRLQFMRGRGLEFFVGKELPVKEKDGISGTVDNAYQGELVEFKSTASDLADDFTPYPWWLQRSKGYCSIHDTDTIHLVVWFLNGNARAKRNGAPIVRTDLRAWTLTFTPDELTENWEYLKNERARMFAGIAAGEVPDEAWVKERRKSFECPGCRFSRVCPRFSGFRGM